jgi:hypothetical protein
MSTTKLETRITRAPNTGKFFFWRIQASKITNCVQLHMEHPRDVSHAVLRLDGPTALEHIRATNDMTSRVQSIPNRPIPNCWRLVSRHFDMSIVRILKKRLKQTPEPPRQRCAFYSRCHLLTWVLGQHLPFLSQIHTTASKAQKLHAQCPASMCAETHQQIQL